MNFLKTILVALVPTLLDWGLKNVKKLAFEVIHYIKFNKKERTVEKRIIKREELTKQIDIATNKGDDEEIKKLYIALHLLDTNK